MTTPSAISVPPSQNWVGNDGPWSSFTVRVGTPAQNVDVLVSTAVASTWVVLPLGCTASDPPNCPGQRGGTFNVNASSSWVPNGLWTLGVEDNLGYKGNGEFGYDTVGLGWQGAGGPTLTGQIVAGIVTKSLYLGVLGIMPRPTNFSDFNHPQPSYLENLKTRGVVPSLSWGYTAGAPYRLDKVFGSLTLGGYDFSRFTPNNVTFPFAAADIRDLSVNLQTIRASYSASFGAGSNTTLLLSKPIYTFIDSTVPDIWLPVEVCREFEATFGLTWNDQSQLYLVNDTQHAALKDRNASFTFQLSATTSDVARGQSVDIILPYAAFDLQAQYPLVPPNTTARYFPLRRAANDAQYTLGRAFLQEAYVTADYERQHFSVSQALFPDPSTPQHLVSIPAPPRPDTRGTQHHLPTPAIAGIVVGVLTLLALLIAPVLYFAIYKPRHTKRGGDAGAQVFDGGKAELDAANGRVFGGELDSTDTRDYFGGTSEMGVDGGKVELEGSSGGGKIGELDGAAVGHELASFAGGGGKREMDGGGFQTGDREVEGSEMTELDGTGTGGTPTRGELHGDGVVAELGALEEVWGRDGIHELPARGAERRLSLAKG